MYDSLRAAGPVRVGQITENEKTLVKPSIHSPSGEYWMERNSVIREVAPAIVGATSLLVMPSGADKRFSAGTKGAG